MNRLITLSERPVLDLRHAAFEHVHGQFLLIGTWYMDRETRDSQPCLVVLNAVRKVQRKKTIPCVVLLEDLWRWAFGERGLGDPAWVEQTISDWMRSGALPGSPNNRKDVFAILNAVHSRLRDVVFMPPLPPKAAIENGAVPVGDLTITERTTGQIVQEIEVVAGNVRN